MKQSQHLKHITRINEYLFLEQKIVVIRVSFKAESHSSSDFRRADTHTFKISMQLISAACFTL
jgi:hypothetical protein